MNPMVGSTKSPEKQQIQVQAQSGPLQDLSIDYNSTSTGYKLLP